MSDTGSARLLIVDDDVVQMRALRDALMLEGYEATGFVSPLDALAVLHPGEYHLLLTDLKMPGMDGIELIDAAGKIDPDLGAIIMTGHGAIDTAVQAMRAGAMDYILKPFRLHAVLPVIRRSLDLLELRRENAALQELERRSSQELAAAYRDLEAFTYSVSHDLRGPLLFVKDFAHRLRQEHAWLLDEEGRHMVQLIHDGSVSLENMIVGLLEFSRSSRQPLRMSPLDMNAIVRTAVAEAYRLHGDTLAQVEVGQLPDAMGDATVIRHVWANLIGNALKFSATRAEPRIAISGYSQGGDTCYTIRDNGVGFDMRYADKLFGVFKRLHRAEDFPGTGVGLAIVRRILARHDGKIWAESAPGEGASFHFTLPSARREQEAAA